MSVTQKGKGRWAAGQGADRYSFYMGVFIVIEAGMISQNLQGFNTMMYQSIQFPKPLIKYFRYGIHVTY